MHSQQHRSKVVAAVIYGAAAIHFLATLGIALAALLFIMSGPDRSAVLAEMRTLHITLAFAGALGVLFSVMAFRFDRLSLALRRVVLVASLAVAVIVGLSLEWWNSLYFILSPLVLALGFREPAHA